MNFRQERVGGLIQQELGKLILRELEFPESLVTITDVVIDKKLDNARVKVSVIPKTKSSEVLEILDEAVPRLQYLLLRIINIKPMPRLKFEIDFGADNAASVEKLLLED